MNTFIGFLIRWGFLACGFGFLIDHVFIFKKQANPLKGTIINLSTESMESTSAKGMKTNYPIIEYMEPDDGETYTLKSLKGRRRKEGLGEELELLLYKKNGWK